MEHTAFQDLAVIIRGRRTRKVDHMNGRKIDAAWVEALLQLADYAPTHGRTEPWRFYVFEGHSFAAFCRDHAQMYREHTPPERFRESIWSKLQHQSDKASHLIITVMKRTPDSKIPAEEEYAAVAAAMQNMLLGASALGLAAIWSTGGMAHHPAMKDYLRLEAADRIVGFLYLGFSDEPAGAGARSIPMAEKVNWKD